MELTESEIRSIVRKELLRSLNEGAVSSVSISRLIGDAMLEAAREVVVRATRDVRTSQALRDMSEADPRRLADNIVTDLLHDPDFKVDLVSLVAAAIKRVK